MTTLLKPTVFILFGATGDLVAKKIAPALYSLSQKGVLPTDFCVMGYGRRELSNETFRAHVREALLKFYPDAPVEKLNAFLELFQYVRGQFHEPTDYVGLLRVLDEQGMSEWNRLFYLAVPPDV